VPSLPPLSRLSHRLTASGIRQLEQAARANPDLISLGPGQPDAALLPLAEIERAMAAASADEGAPARFLQYGPSQGDPELVALIVERMRAQGVACDASHVLVTSGSQQALDLICQLTLDPGDGVLVQPFTYPGALQVFRARGARVTVLPGHRPAEPSGAKLLYAMADFQNPTGQWLDERQRGALVARAREEEVLLVEDAPYRDLVFEDGEQPPSLLQIDAAGRSPDSARTLHLGSFSKVVAPGLRIGWIVGPAALIERLTLLRQASDLQPSTLSQAVLVGVLRGGDQARMRRLRLRYAERHAALERALQRHLAGIAQWQPARGGFFLWVKLGLAVDTRELLPTAIRHGVAYVPGREFCADERGARHLRLSFSSVDPGRMDEAVRRLAAAIVSLARREDRGAGPLQAG